MPRPILLVEDEENDVFFMQEAMKRAGVLNPIRVASDGQQAIDYFKGAGKFGNREEFPLPYLVLLDLKLPYVMGLDVLKWIRQQSEVPAMVVILSSSNEEADIATAYRWGANGYLVKPPDVAKLLDLVKSIKDFWLTQNTPPPRFHENGEVAGLAHRSRREGLGDPPPDNTRETFLNNAQAAR
jgi:DNA-binding response OmpR family regulator